MIIIFYNSIIINFLNKLELDIEPKNMTGDNVLFKNRYLLG